MGEGLELRVLIDEARGGAANMGVDEAILEGVESGESPATLRFYGWAEPTVSLGYFQRYAEFLEQDEVIRRMPLVRRPTGGGAILHDDELTYSLVLPLKNQHAPAGNAGDDMGVGMAPAGKGVFKGSSEIENLYRLMHNAFIEVLGRWSVKVCYRGGEDPRNSRRGGFFCFARRYRLDLVIGQDKLLGSAQRRLKKAVLQHGSLILRRRFREQPSAELKAAAAKQFDRQELIEQMAVQVAGSLQMEAAEGSLNAGELRRIKALENKYAGPEWNRRR